ncbi:hypothetical protein ACHAXM_001844 [Skeletonema potamos]
MFLLLRRRPLSATASIAGRRYYAGNAAANLSSVPFFGSNHAWRNNNNSSSNNGCKRKSFSTANKSSSNRIEGGSSASLLSSPPSSSNMTIRYSTSKHNLIDSTATKTPIEQQLSALQSEIAHLSYLIKQTSTQQLETAALSRRAEARAYIIEHKLMDIQSHVVKIPEMEHFTKILRQYLEKYSPSLVSDVFQRATAGRGRDWLMNKYTFWITLGSLLVFWQYRITMYQRTSEEIADVAAMTLQQTALRTQIQETLSTVANSPTTLASLSLLFQQLISEERTQQHLIDLIVRALGSEGVRLAALSLLDLCFQNEELQHRAGEFLKVAAKVAVLDEGVQQSAGVGIQKALKSAVLPWWVRKSLGGEKEKSKENRSSSNEEDDEEEDEEDGLLKEQDKDDDNDAERASSDVVVVLNVVEMGDENEVETN